MHEFRFFNQRHALINPDNFLAGSEGSKRTILYRRHFSDFKAGKISAEKLARIKSDLRNPSRVTRIVFNISRQNFGLHGAPTKEFVQGILDWMNKNISYVGERVGSKSIGLMHLMYGKLSAEDILVKRKIPTVFNEMGDPLFGCGEACDAFIALLKTFRGIDRIRHVRVTVPSFDPETRKLGLTAHSVVMFQIAKKAFLADPFNKGQIFLTGKTLAPLEGDLAKKVKILKNLQLWREGNSLLDFNKSFKDYINEKSFLASMAKNKGKTILKAFQAG